jgi:hypothetical protein
MMDIKIPVVACWFVGGPWNNQLWTIAEWLVEAHRELRIPVSERPDWTLAMWPKDVISPFDCQIAEYYPQAPLPTGTPVYSCLVGRFGDYYDWRLPSFPVFK